MNLYQSGGKAKVWRRKGSDTNLWLKHFGVSVMAWVWKDASRASLLIFINNKTRDGSLSMDLEFYGKMFSDNLQRNASDLNGDKR